MCSLQEHSARPIYKAEEDAIYQYVDGQWVNITPGYYSETADSPQSTTHGSDQLGVTHGA